MEVEQHLDDHTKEILANRDIAALRVTTADIKKREVALRIYRDVMRLGKQIAAKHGLNERGEVVK